MYLMFKTIYRNYISSGCYVASAMCHSNVVDLPGIVLESLQGLYYRYLNNLNGVCMKYLVFAIFGW